MGCNSEALMSIKTSVSRLHWWLHVVECHSGDSGSILIWEDPTCPTATEPCATTTEPMFSGPHTATTRPVHLEPLALQQEEPLQRGFTHHCYRVQLEKACTQQQKQHSQKINKILKERQISPPHP